MSRLVVYDLKGFAEGEIRANCSRGWAINEGGQASAALSRSAALQPFVQFGRIVTIDHPRLPGWAGMIDTPWTGGVPAQMTIYNAPYLMNIRNPAGPDIMRGTPGALARRLMSYAQKEGDLQIREGEIEDGGGVREESFDQRSFWEQLKEFAKKTGMEVQFRPELGSDNRLAIYMDFKKRLGVDSPFLLHDGPGGNAQFSAPKIDGDLWNCIRGIGEQASKEARLTAGPVRDEDAISRYRLRSKVSQFKVNSVSELRGNIETELASAARPRLELTVKALDKGETFTHLRLGNRLLIHSARVIIPGGIEGWYGAARIMAMAYDEKSNTVSIKMEALL